MTIFTGISNFAYIMESRKKNIHNSPIGMARFKIPCGRRWGSVYFPKQNIRMDINMEILMHEIKTPEFSFYPQGSMAISDKFTQVLLRILMFTSRKKYNQVKSPNTATENNSHHSKLHFGYYISSILIG